MKNKTIQGQISINSKGIGFIALPEEKEDVMIETHKLHTALNRDTVEVKVLAEKLYGRPTGEVINILKRNKMEFVGTIEEDKGKFWLETDDKRMYMDILITEIENAYNGDKVLVEIKEWNEGKSPVGKVLKVIGKKGEHNAEMESIILEKGFDPSFPPEVSNAAEKIAREAFPISEEEIEKRKDFRDTLTFTIDPKDAKDFDDALSFKKLPNGNVEIGVHIADVSHYVRPGEPLDKEAFSRGCSVYLVDRTIPMLPHALSNVICSLNPNEDRLAFGAVFEMDNEGNILSRWFGKTIIHSNKRFTYENAQEVLDAKSGEHFEVLDFMNRIAKKYIDMNAFAGAINFETEEIKFELDEKGVPLRVIKKQRLDTHKMIEQYMLLANREVAEFIHTEDTKIRDKVEGLIYRVHEAPDHEKIRDLAILVRALGHQLPLNKKGEVNAKDLNHLFKQIEGKAEESLIKTAAVRSMSKAIYATENTGHFGLAFEYYTHFTSPIRRYPDLLVHRILETYLDHKKLGNSDVAFFEEAAENSTEREIAASEAERASIKYKQVEYWAPRVGAELSGVISGVTEWGVYVEEEETKAEGMIRLKDMSDDTYLLDEKTYSVIGQKTGNKITLGDKVKMKLMRADIDRKTLDFALTV